MKKKAFAAIFAVLFTANLQASTVGLYLGGQIWQSEASGVFGEENTLSDINLNKEQRNSFFIAVEHPFPLLPNVRIASTTVDVTDKTTLTQEYSDDNETSHVNVYVDSDIDASFNVSYVDYTLYYQVFDTDLFSFDLGLTARDFDGAVTVTETANTVTRSWDYIWDGEEHKEHDYHWITKTGNTVTEGKTKLDDIEPMLYVATSINLPLRGLSVFAQGDYLLKGGHSLYDYQVGLSCKLVNSRKVDFNLTLGYRAVKMEFEGLDDLYTDLEFKGVFVGAILYF